MKTMVDEILDLRGRHHCPEEVESLKSKVLCTNDPRLLYLFAYYFEDECDTNDLEGNLIRASSPSLKYLLFYIRSIKRCNFDKIFRIILDLGKPKDIYYTVYDIKDIKTQYIVLAANRLMLLGDKKYFGLLLYYYFNILCGHDGVMEQIASNYLGVDDVDGVRATLECRKNEMYADIDVCGYEGFTGNHFSGRNGCVPDMIVCHISNDYKKAVRTFYDEKSETSCHFVISRTGEVKQAVALSDAAWGNGTSEDSESDAYYRFAANSLVRDRKINANYYTFSIEHESLDGSLTELQYISSLRVVRQIIEYVKDEYDVCFQPDRYHLVGHRELNPITRRICPGDKFPFDRMINDLRAVK